MIKTVVTGVYTFYLMVMKSIVFNFVQEKQTSRSFYHHKYYFFRYSPFHKKTLWYTGILLYMKKWLSERSFSFSCFLIFHQFTCNFWLQAFGPTLSSGVLASLSPMLLFACHSRRTLTMSAWPLAQARCSAVLKH